MDRSVQYVKGVGEARAKLLKRLGIETVGDLLHHFPRAYEDRSRVVPIGELTEGESACVCAEVASPVTSYRGSGGGRSPSLRSPTIRAFCRSHFSTRNM